MRLRVLLGGVAAALAVSAFPAAAAEVHPACADGFEILCTVICRIEKPCG